MRNVSDKAVGKIETHV